MKTVLRKISVAAGLLLIVVSGGAFSQSTGVPDKDPDLDSKHYEGESSRHFQEFAENESVELTKALKAALDQKGPDYIPRTEHLNVDKSPHYTNRLISEDSPYLIQHAHNPVNWYPWGEEAFEKAWNEDKPVFMSIGYATCHWCHVMERESFENKEIAAFMNEHFVSIKVDREQRPDIDATYMMAVQMIAGRGGWPMSSFLTDAAKPFFGGTYYPPDAFLDLLKRVDTVWKTQKDSLLNEADELSAAVARSSDLQGEAAEIGESVIDQAVENLLGNHDDLQGGFSMAPKFPQEPSHFLLLEQARLKSDKKLLSVSDFSLTMMASGGIHDQVAGGFHRYSVDNEWLVPHFEKMLYNQAALARLYFQAYTLTADELHLRTARRILDYIQREMTSPEGGFYSATDADSEGEEGVFFVWTPEELEQALGKDDAKLASAIWGVTDGGNFEHSNILNLEDSIEEIAVELGLNQSALIATMDRIAAVLLEKRQTRIPPLLDDKLITEWNAMMITAFAEVATGLDDNTYRETAIKAANVIWKHNHRDDGRLWRAHFAGRSSIEANQADYAFLAEAMIALYDLTYEQHWLDKAVDLTQTMTELFLDPGDSTYFMGSLVVSGAALPSRPKDLFDNATASGNSAALRTLTRLWARTGQDKYREQATALLAAFHTSLTSYSSGFGYLLTAASELLHGESGAIRYAGRGNVRLVGTLQSENEILLNVDVKPGWHINSRKPIQDYLIPTRILDNTGTELKSLKYPEPSIQTLGFERSKLSLYDGSFVISADIPRRSEKDLPGLRTVVLELQACNDETCLAPESVRLNIQVSGQTL